MKEDFIIIVEIDTSDRYRYRQALINNKNLTNEARTGNNSY